MRRQNDFGGQEQSCLLAGRQCYCGIGKRRARLDLDNGEHAVPFGQDVQFACLGPHTAAQHRPTLARQRRAGGILCFQAERMGARSLPTAQRHDEMVRPHR